MKEDLGERRFRCMNVIHVYDFTVNVVQELTWVSMDIKKYDSFIGLKFKYDKETASNQKLAKDLVDKWVTDLGSKPFSFLFQSRTFELQGLRVTHFMTFSILSHTSSLLQADTHRKLFPPCSSEAMSIVAPGVSTPPPAEVSMYLVKRVELAWFLTWKEEATIFKLVNLACSHLDYQERKTARSLGDHLGTPSTENTLVDGPDRLSEDLIRCISSIYCKLGDQNQSGPSVSSASSLSSIYDI
ncbi:hypothetical protein L1887_30117 [Cichorium endivia]|nr:hypothetical protein L1887_30117 [Cichorium endivia]